MNGILIALISHRKLDRDHGLDALGNLLDSNIDSGIEKLLLKLCKEKVFFEENEIRFETNVDPPWEQVHGAISGISVYITKRHDVCCTVFYDDCNEVGRLGLSHHESRVRISAGQLLGCLSKYKGVQIYMSCREDLLAGIQLCLEHQDEADVKIKEKLNGDKVFPDTAGWGNLETNMKALECVIMNTEAAFDECIDSKLLDLIFKSLEHPNRFVRETGYMVCCALVSIHPLKEESTQRGRVWSDGARFATFLEKGLVDNWSQVRMAACCATRAFLLGIPVDGREEYFPQLLPPLCLNRYYIAEGVRIHCQATWRMLFSVSGVSAVEQNLAHIVPFYVLQSEADNHAVREAACSCIAELATKIGTDPVRQHVPTLIQGLLVCFRDDSWPVRDSACIACGNFVSAFPDECEEYLDKLMPLFLMNLKDNIPSVRQGAAVAIKRVVFTYQDKLLPDMLTKLDVMLDAVLNQTDDSEQFSELSNKPAVFGVAMAEDHKHTDQVMYSCGSLAPKMGRGGQALDAGGCSASHHFTRPTQEWEITEGGIRLFVELCDIQVAKASLVPFLPKLVAAVDKRDYAHHRHLLETVYRILPIVCRRLTKAKIKPYINDFMPGLYYGLKSSVNLLRAASVECLQSLSLLLGPNILRGRIESVNYDMLLYVKDAFPETIGC